MNGSLLTGIAALAFLSQAPPPGVAVNPHVWPDEILYVGTPPEEVGVLVTLVWRSPVADQGAALPDGIKGREPAQLTLACRITGHAGQSGVPWGQADFPF